MVILLMLVLPLGAETSVPDALKKAKADVVGALAELSAVRDTITKEKPAMAREFQQTEFELKDKRRLARIARMSREDRAAEMRSLEQDRTLRKQDAGYLAGLLKDHALRIEPHADSLWFGKCMHSL